MGHTSQELDGSVASASRCLGVGCIPHRELLSQITASEPCFPQGMEDPAGTSGARTCGKCCCTKCSQKFFSQRVLSVLVLHLTVPQASSLTQAVLFPSAAPWTCGYASRMLVTREMTGNSWKVKPKKGVGETNLSQATKSLMVPTTACCRDTEGKQMQLSHFSE